MEFSFSVNWDIKRSDFRNLACQAFKYATKYELRRVSIERLPYKGQIQYQVFTSKNGCCSPQPSIEAAYITAIERIENR